MSTATLATPHRRAVCFQHVRTGRIITAPSITAFARKARLGPYGKYQFDNVLKGHRIHVRGWGHPERLNQHVEVKDVWGNRWAGTVNDLRCIVSATAANRLARGEPCGNVLPAGVAVKDQIAHRPLRYTGYAVKRGSTVYRGRTLREVASKVGMSITPIWGLVHGRQQRTKCGLTLQKAYAVRRSALKGCR